MKNNEQAKQEAIKKAYGEFYEPNKDIIHADGTVTSFIGCKMEEKGLIMDYFANQRAQTQSLGVNFYNNNGWIRIEPDGSNLPIIDYTKDIIFYKYMVGDKISVGEVYANDIKSLRELYPNQITHYKPIKQELKPIY